MPVNELFKNPVTRITTAYVVVASVWILFSDAALDALSRSGIDKSLASTLGTMKGFAFVAFTAILLHFVLRREFTARLRIENDLKKQIEYAAESQLELEKSEQRFRKAVEEAPFPIMIFAEDGEVLSVSQTWLDITGYTNDQLRTLDSWTELAYGERKQRIRGGIDRLFSLNSRMNEGEFTVTCAVGAQRIWAFSSTPLGHLPDNRRIVISIAADVTERKNLENDLHRANQFLQTLIQASPLGIVAFTADGTITLWNPAMETLLGWTEAEVIGHGLPYVREQDQAEFTRLQQHVAAGQTFKGIDVQRQCKDGTVIDLSLSAGPLRDMDGAFTGVVGIVKDIRERKRIETALRASEERLRMFIEHAPASLAMFDREMRYVIVSHRWMADYHLGENDIVGQSHYEVFPEIPERWKRLHERGMAGEILKAEEDEFERSNGQVQWLRWEIHPWYTADETVGGIIVFTEDITERRHIQDALRDSEQRFRLLIQKAPEGIFVQVNHCFVYLNPAACRLFGAMDDTELIGAPVLERFHLDFHDQIRQRIHHLNQERVSVPLVEEVFLRVDGTPFTVEVSAVPIKYQGNSGALVFFHDITERKQMETALRESELRFRQIAENIREVFYLTDADKHEMLYVSPAYETIWGRSRESLYQNAQSFLEAVHPNDRNKVLATFEQQRHGQPIEVIYRVVRPDQVIRWVRSRAFPVFDATPTHRRIAGITEDITERVRYQNQLRRLSRRLVTMLDDERARIARELHDQIGQQLTGLGINLAIIEAQCEADHPALPVIGESSELISTIIERIRAIISNLRPLILDDMGLVAGLRWYCEKYTRRTGIVVVLDDALTTPPVNPHVDNTFYQIAQEALTNVARHAEATIVHIALSSDERRLTMRISDNGKGFDTATLPHQHHTESWGLQIMQERIQGLASGRLRIESAAGQGTLIIAEVQL